jgi:uncharacterized protein involved in exopolysaccharide biosynthesis
MRSFFSIKYPEKEIREFNDLIEYLKLNIHWIGKILFLFLIIGLIIAFFSQKWYRSEVTIYIAESDQLSNLAQYKDIASVFGLNLPGNKTNQLKIFKEILHSNFLIKKLINEKFYSPIKKDSLYIYQIINFDFKEKDSISFYESLEKFKKVLFSKILFVFLDDENNILKIRIDVPDYPFIAAQITNKIVDILRDYNQNYRLNKARINRKFIEKQLILERHTLENLWEKLIEFYRQNKSIQSPEQKVMLEKLMSELEVKKALFLELKKQYEIAKINENRDISSFDTIEKAYPNTLKIKPKRILIIFVTLIAGTFFTIFYLIFKIRF